MKRNFIIPARIVALLSGIGFLIVGLMNGEWKGVLVKAVRVCLECIGIG